MGHEGESFASPNRENLIASVMEQAAALGIALPPQGSDAVAHAHVYNVRPENLSELLQGRSVRFLDETPNAFRQHQRDINGNGNSLVGNLVVIVIGVFSFLVVGSILLGIFV